MDENEFKELVKVLKTLGSETRLKIILCLLEKKKEYMKLGKIIGMNPEKDAESLSIILEN